MGDSGLESVQTCGEIRAFFEAGKALSAYMDVAPGTKAYSSVSVIALDNDGGSMIVSGVDGGSQTLTVMNLSANSDSDVFTMMV